MIIRHTELTIQYCIQHLPHDINTKEFFGKSLIFKHPKGVMESGRRGLRDEDKFLVSLCLVYASMLVNWEQLVKTPNALLRFAKYYHAFRCLTFRIV